MSVAPQPKLLSHDDYLLMPDEPRGEVLDGVFFVTPSPRGRHQLLVGFIYRQIGNWLDEHPQSGQVYVAPFDVILKRESPATVVQPDVLFISAERAEIVNDWVFGAPDLVVEVLSPTSASRDSIKKRRTYDRFGVREYWMVSPDEGTVHVFASGEEPRELEGDAVLESPILPGFKLEIARIFQAADGPGKPA